MISNADFQKIRLLAFDIDGTLTDGTYSYIANGETLKFFSMQDQHWLKLAKRAGLQTAFISGRSDSVSRKFAADAMVDFAVYGAKSKLNAFHELLEKFDLDAENVLYAGDDIVDMPILRRAGIAVIPANAVPSLDEVASWRTAAAGGAGVAREIIHRVLVEKNLYDQIMERYRQ